ncbi:hypothetical protein BCR41DRAFT_101219 [Lobosporangium transversale]|uniref:Ndc10 domain-containing protein n=1 Tax=Lobosporangium transversale TaxID=64571 RepID=A0A1Y2GJA0_9FUNG|nr:hypothetical protein BCR41DRAFT_101219 [Lobosporangium transversale]ORZ12519.1 hypothetical protein BCR41DRAFT_101219 [Lobosporangium transversale]|eukprot:XP_021880138.1 hypothetical protein BCR41DRAFT_101219 [Lobosporangium transversale]
MDIAIMLKNYRFSLVYDQLQPDLTRRVDCPLRNAYSPKQFVQMLMTLWRDPIGLNRRSANIRDHFSMAIHHQMMLRDEDIRHLRFSECFHKTLDGPQTAYRKISSLIFRIQQGEANKSGASWYSCAVRHVDV